MKKYFIDLRTKVVNLKSAGSFGLAAVFYRTFFVVLKLLIILFAGSDFAFPLLYQIEGAKSTTFSYQEFKNYQTKIRIVFLLTLALAITLITIY